MAEVVGIDLGTTNSAVAVLDAEARPRLMPVDGKTICPSVVSFPGGGEVLAGWPARNRLAYDPERTVRSAKRSMGREGGWEIDGRLYTAPEIQAEVLRRLARAAGEAEGGPAPEKAVITVPAYFDQVQRQATREAGEQAGLEVVRLLNEPTAAALAHHPDGGARQLLVYDLGGGTFDASLVRQDGDLVEVLASHGDTQLGGDDLDHALLERVLDRFAAAQGLETRRVRELVLHDPVASARLTLAVEEAKCALSSRLEAPVRLEYLLETDGVAPHLDVELRRGDVEEVAGPLLERTLASVDRVLSDGRVDGADLDGILLVGGSTRTPAVGRALHERFDVEPDGRLDPDACVALGAGVQAGLSQGKDVERILVDVSPYSLSVGHLELQPHPHIQCRVVIPRNTPVPSRRAERFWGLSPEQDEARLYVFQGGDPDPCRNRCIGRLEIRGLRPDAGEEVPDVACHIDYDLDGVAKVTASNRGSGRSERATFRVDGLGSQDVSEQFLADVEADGIAPGPGRAVGERVPAADVVTAPSWSSAPAALAREAAGGGAAPAGAGVATTASPAAEPALPEELVEDYRVVERIAGSLPELEQRHAESAAELRQRVAAAREAFRREPLDAEAASDRYDRLTDLLFDLGEFF